MSDYLIHFNKNHSSKDGRFVSGDGDGDGLINDRTNRKKEKTGDKDLKETLRKKSTEQLIRGFMDLGVGTFMGYITYKNIEDGVNLVSACSGLSAAMMYGSGMNNITQALSTKTMLKKYS